MTAIVLALLCAPLTESHRVDDIRVENLWITREATVLRELTFAAGDVVTPEAWSLFETRLWNLGIFSRVDLQLVEEGERSVAVVHIEDQFPLAPVAYFQFGGGQFFLWAGAYTTNFLGRALEVLAYYQRFGELNGFHVHIMDPRLFSTRTKGQLEVERLARPRPEFLQVRNVLRLSVEANAPGVTDDQVRFGVRVEGSRDEFSPQPDVSTPLPSWGVQAAPYLKVGRLDTDRLRFSRGFVEVRALVGVTDDSEHAVWNQGELEAQWFVKWGSRFNLATRLKAGAAFNARPQDRFYLGGLEAVRGYVDSEFRALSHAFANVELRFIAFDSTLFAVMPMIFVDGGVAHLDNRTTIAMASGGAGLHLLVPRLPLFGVRVEVAFPFVRGPLTALFAPNFNFGVWHFF